jgi:hypothetical protein
MQTDNQVIQFKPRPPKAATQRWIGPIEAERERCLTVCLHPAAQGNWSNAARVLLCETAMSAEAIIENLKSWRAESTAQLCADFAAGRFNTAGTI